MILKPAEQTPLSALRLAELIAGAALAAQANDTDSGLGAGIWTKDISKANSEKLRGTVERDVRGSGDLRSRPLLSH